MAYLEGVVSTAAASTEGGKYTVHIGDERMLEQPVMSGDTFSWNGNNQGDVRMVTFQTNDVCCEFLRTREAIHHQPVVRFWTEDAASAPRVTDLILRITDFLCIGDSRDQKVKLYTIRTVAVMRKNTPAPCPREFSVISRHRT